MPSSLKKAWFTPVFSSILAGRLESMVLAGFAILQVGLHWAGLAGWTCPFKALLGIPCPGCGLTLAVDELIHGHWLASFHAHAFAPVFLLAFLALFASLFLPAAARSKLVQFVAVLESRTAISAWVLTLLMLYWCMRLFALV